MYRISGYDCGSSALDPAVFSGCSQPCSEADCTDFPCIYHGDPHNTGICIWTDVHPCDGTGTICGTSDDVPVLDRHDSKMFIESIEDLDTKILESLDAAGCTMFQKIRYGILSQLFPDFMSTLIYRFDMNLRDATVLGLVGAGGIGAPLIFAMSAYKWNQVGAILAGLIVLILIVEVISTKIRVKLTRG